MPELLSRGWGILVGKAKGVQRPWGAGVQGKEGRHLALDPKSLHEELGRARGG